MTLESSGIGSKTYTPVPGEYGFDDHKTVTTLKQFIQDYAAAPKTGSNLTLRERKIRRISFVHCVGSRQIPGIHEPVVSGNPDGKYPLSIQDIGIMAESYSGKRPAVFYRLYESLQPSAVSTQLTAKC